MKNLIDLVKGWQPIETAPTGVQVLVSNGEWFECDIKENGIFHNFGTDANFWCSLPDFGIMEQLKQLIADYKQAVISLTECHEAMAYMSDYDITICMLERTKASVKQAKKYKQLFKRVGK